MSGENASAGLLTFGESMGLISTPDIGPIEFARHFRCGIGGAESNVAIGAARLGTDAAWIGRVGNDATGDLIERRLRAEGVRAHVTGIVHVTGITPALSESGPRRCLRRRHEPAALTVPVLDSVGAGDAFAAGYLAEHLAGQPPEQRLRTAIATGCVRRDSLRRLRRIASPP